MPSTGFLFNKKGNKNMAAKPHGDLLRVNSYVAGGEIKIGDFVRKNSDGKVVVAAASQAPLGVAMSYASDDGKEIIVADHPDQEYLVDKSASAPSSQTDYGLNYNIVASTSTYKESAHKLDSASGATTSTLPLRAVMPSRRVGSTSEAVVRINNHSEKAGVEGL